MKRSHLIGTGIIVVFGVFGASAFVKSLTPYVSFEEARASGRTVQVRGARVKGSERFDEQTQASLFDLRDEHDDILNVVFDGIKQGNFDQAPELVVIGRYRDDAFHANRMLVKCPSKYEAKEAAGGTAPH